jgi:hypothetical protein
MSSKLSETLAELNDSMGRFVAFLQSTAVHKNTKGFAHKKTARLYARAVFCKRRRAEI